jgi:hypothetical protein
MKKKGNDNAAPAPKKPSLMSRWGKDGMAKKKSSIEDHNDSCAILNSKPSSYKPREEHPSLKDARESMLDDMMEPEE